MSQCHEHPNRQATTLCNHCGNIICEDCAVRMGYETVCKSCVSEYVDVKPKVDFGEGKITKKRKFNMLFLLFWACMPGAGYMYLGLMKKGLFVMSIFFLSTYSTVLLKGGVFAFVIPLIWFFSFFDVFNIRRRLLDGESIPDSLEPLLASLAKHKSSIIFVIAIALAIEFLAALRGYNNHMFWISKSGSSAVMGIAIAIIIAGIVIILKSKKRN